MLLSSNLSLSSLFPLCPTILSSPSFLCLHMTLTCHFLVSLSPPSTCLSPPNIPGSAVERSPVRNIEVFNPTTNTLNVRWEPADGPVLQYRVVYSPLTGSRPSESVSFHPASGKKCRSARMHTKKTRRCTVIDLLQHKLSSYCSSSKIVHYKHRGMIKRG